MSEPGPPSSVAPPGARAARRGALGLCLLVVLELAVTAWHWGRAPAEADWRAAGAALAAARSPGEPVLIAPGWAGPLGRQVAARDVPVELFALSDVDRFARLWHLSIRDAVHPWVAGLAPAERRRFGAVVLARYDKSAEVGVRDLTAEFGDARVERIDATGARPCARAGGSRWICEPAEAGAWIGPHLAEVDAQPYRCVRAPPSAGGAVRLTYPATPVAERLVVYTGIDDVTSRKLSQVPVRFTVRAGERVLLDVVHASDAPWTRHELPWPAAGSGAPAEFAPSFEVAAAQVAHRTFCFHAELRGGRTGGAP